MMTFPSSGSTTHGSHASTELVKAKETDCSLRQVPGEADEISSFRLPSVLLPLLASLISILNGTFVLRRISYSSGEDLVYPPARG